MSVAASLIATTMNASTPLLLAALGILVAERSGVLNLGVEGIMLMAAIVAYIGAVESGSFAVGFLAAILIGIAFALFFAIFAVGLRANQQASGLGVAIFGAGLSRKGALTELCSSTRFLLSEKRSLASIGLSICRF